MWAPQNNKVINALFLTFFLSCLIHTTREPFLKIPEKERLQNEYLITIHPIHTLSGRVFCNVAYDLKSSQNKIISKLGDVKRFPSQDREGFMSPQIQLKSCTCEKWAPDLY